MSALHRYVRRHHWGMLACAISLSGTAYAAGVLPAASVGPRQLRDGAVTPKKLSKATRRAVAAKPGPPGPAGPAGPQGAAGPEGAAGAPGPPGPSDTQTFDGLDTVVVQREVPEVTLAPANGTSRHTFCGDNGVFLNATYTVTTTSGPAPEVTQTNTHNGLTLGFWNGSGETSVFTVAARLRCLVSPAP